MSYPKPMRFLMLYPDENAVDFGHMKPYHIEQVCDSVDILACMHESGTCVDGDKLKKHMMYKYGQMNLYRNLFP